MAQTHEPATSDHAYVRVGADLWRPGSLARGPFAGLQGGGVAALMCAAIEDSVEGFVASVTTHFLRPAPLAPLRVAVRPLREGRRVSVIDATLNEGETLVAIQRATMIAAQDAPTLPEPPDEPADPPQHPLRDSIRGVAVRPYMLDAFELRVAPDGDHWFRPRAPIVGAGGPMTRVLPVADWAHGLPRPLGAERVESAAIPNPDVTVHLFRAPVSDWIGLSPQTAWSRQSIGVGWAALKDTRGLIGRVAMSVAIIDGG